VMIRDARPDTAPLVEHHYGTDPDGHDRAVLTEALELLHTITAEPDLAQIIGQPAHEDRDPLAHIASYCHPAGTCRMGPSSDRAAVVDATGAVHGIEGVYVADASVMASISRGNINLPTAMIGARIAAGLLDLAPAAVAVPATTP
jgi:choline dehydrogenase